MAKTLPGGFMESLQPEAHNDRHPEVPAISLSLALQGGGAHGAFTWGVLDRLLDDPLIHIERISGASAGALNGVALASGYARGGRAGAKRNLELLWNKVAEAGSLMALLQVPIRKPGMGVWDDFVPLFSPYQTNPLALEPLRYIVDAVTRSSALQTPPAPQLFVSAVNVRTGAARIFGPSDISNDAVVASAAAPLTYPAVPIDGDHYWDGSYAGDPVLSPLYEGRDGTDILVVRLTTLCRREAPTSAKNILNRINEIASINGLRTEVAAVDRMNRSAGHSLVRLHMVSFADGMSSTEPSIKRTVGLALFNALRNDGYETCDQWLARHRVSIGKKSTLDEDWDAATDPRHGVIESSV